MGASHSRISHASIIINVPASRSRLATNPIHPPATSPFARPTPSPDSSFTLTMSSDYEYSDEDIYYEDDDDMSGIQEEEEGKIQPTKHAFCVHSHLTLIYS